MLETGDQLKPTTYNYSLPLRWKEKLKCTLTSIMQLSECIYLMCVDFLFLWSSDIRLKLHGV